MALDDNQPEYTVIGTRLIDGKEPSCWQVGCPIWVRLLPGTHKFVVRFATGFESAPPLIKYWQTDVKIEVKDMMPRHVYVARYKRTTEGLTVLVEDLGENPEFGVWIGLKGVNRKYHRVSF
ncbi:MULTISPECIES: hypothetical protein [Paraburkholderia]|uniref:hypothetical protein n=1 Tax=Paraburkholderia TaxID=1822464 RepID=UPI00224F0A06|nr:MULTISPECIES: hypothetical protein [Paraburkholderia]MCX4164260.1 hypothetical protein [Paraburkholderia megapolitana]MDN7159753.1 hypothetical protein [Paraburkholderia sp. CHISQ3]MDQ6496800.1 hypothetical protein [Paraburkholderia megapolitana]